MLAGTQPARAQRTASIDAGWASVRYDQYLRSSVFTVTPSLRLEYPLSLIAVRASLSAFESGSSSVDYSLSASTFTRPHGVLRGELSATGGGGFYNGYGSGHVNAEVRVHAISGQKGLWLGAGEGYVDDGILASSATRYGGGAWVRLEGVTVNFAAQHFRGGGVRLTDLEGGLRLSKGAVSYSSSAGLRSGFQEIDGSRYWGEVSGSFWLGNHMALVAAHGRYPAEAGRGTPGGRYTALALRLSNRRPVEPLRISNRRFDIPPLAPPVVSAFQFRTISANTRSIVIRAPGAETVEIAGDFTDWQPVTLTRRPGSSEFSLKHDIPPGLYKFNLRVDAGEWGVPPGVPLLRDEFSGVIAVLIIQQRDS